MPELIENGSIALDVSWKTEPPLAFLLAAQENSDHVGVSSWISPAEIHWTNDQARAVLVVSAGVEHLRVVSTHVVWKTTVVRLQCSDSVVVTCYQEYTRLCSFCRAVLHPNVSIWDELGQLRQFKLEQANNELSRTPGHLWNAKKVPFQTVLYLDESLRVVHG